MILSGMQLKLYLVNYLKYFMVFNLYLQAFLLANLYLQASIRFSQGKMVIMKFKFIRSDNKELLSEAGAIG